MLAPPHPSVSGGSGVEERERERARERERKSHVVDLNQDSGLGSNSRRVAWNVDRPALAIYKQLNTIFQSWE